MKLDWEKFINYIAFSISSVFSPYIAAAIFIILVVYNYAHDLNQFLPWMLTFFAFAVVVPGVYILWLLESKKIQDIHMAKLDDRTVPFLVTAISSLTGTVLLYFLHAAKQVFMISAIYTINSLVISLITQKWKISVHTGTYATIVTLTVLIFGIRFWWLYLFLVPLAWSRIHRKRHTMWQTVAGALVSTLLTIATFVFLKLIQF